MDTLIQFFVFCQVFGALFGAIAATSAEVVYIVAIRQEDGKEVAERAHLRSIGKGLRLGMSIVLLSSFLIVVFSYVLHSFQQPALTVGYWIFMALALLIIFTSWCLARRHVHFQLGSAALLTAWWLLVYLSGGQLSITFGAAAALYVVLSAIIYAILWLIHLIASPKK